MDIDISFEKNLINGNIIQNDDINAVKARIRNILLLREGEVTYRDHIYSNVNDLLGENISYTTAAAMKGNIEYILNKYIPEITITNIQVGIDYDKQSYYIKIQYNIINNMNNIEQIITLQHRN